MKEDSSEQSYVSKIAEQFDQKGLNKLEQLNSVKTFGKGSNMKLASFESTIKKLENVADGRKKVF